MVAQAQRKADRTAVLRRVGAVALVSAMLSGAGEPSSQRAAQPREHIQDASNGDVRPPGVHACPVETMSCYPGCAVVGGTYSCGRELVHLVGSIAAAIEAIARTEGVPLEDFCEKHEALCAKGGKQRIDNEYVEKARLLPKGVDPCQWLKSQYAEATTRGDTVAKLKLKMAQKALGCRQTANDY